VLIHMFTRGRCAIAAKPSTMVGRRLDHETLVRSQLSTGRPRGIVVNQTGQIVWIGHPIELAEPLAAIIDGNWDLSAKSQAHREELAKNKVRERFRLRKGVNAALLANDTAGAVSFINEAFAAHPEFELDASVSQFDALACESTLR